MFSSWRFLPSFIYLFILLDVILFFAFAIAIIGRLSRHYCRWTYFDVFSSARARTFFLRFLLLSRDIKAHTIHFFFFPPCVSFCWWWMSFSFFCLWYFHLTPISMIILYLYWACEIISFEIKIYLYIEHEICIHCVYGRCFFVTLKLLYVQSFFFKHSSEQVKHPHCGIYNAFIP